MGVNVDWPSAPERRGYFLQWGPDQPAEDKALFLYDAARKTWTRMGERQACPQNLYELTALAYDGHRDQVILHGAGKDRDELWAFDLPTKQWKNLKPRVASPAGTATPACNRESVYLPDEDVLLTYGPGRAPWGGPVLWSYKVSENAWYRVALDPPPGVDPRTAASQNRALVYDPQRHLVLLVIGAGGDRGTPTVFALRYQHAQATFVEQSER